MKLLQGILAILLVLGFLTIPNCVFAGESESVSSNCISGNSDPEIHYDGVDPMIKGGGKSGGSSSSVSKSTKKTDIDGDDNSTDDGQDTSGWLIWVILGIIGIIIVAVALVVFRR
ncbi:MAG: hypothetical protein FJ150_06425 [Euryarchaeota archaeon]|nr:hypothetical protein [Euryarchaeota archaeon]